MRISEHKGATVAALVTAIGAGGAGAWWLGSDNPETPPGHIGYVTQDPILGETEFVGLQTGPASPGRHWRYNVLNVSITPFPYDEDFPLDRAPLSIDGLPIQFHLTTIWRVNPDKVQQFVEKFVTLDDAGKLGGEAERKAFDSNIKPQIRTMALSEIHKRGYMDVSTELDQINASLLKRARAEAEGTPFEIISVNVGNVQFPPQVSKAVAERMAKGQELERMATELEITRKKAEQRVVEARGIAESQKIIAGTLTPEYLAHEAIEAQKALRDSPNHSVVYIPTNQAGVPVLTTSSVQPTPRTLTPAAHPEVQSGAAANE